MDMSQQTIAKDFLAFLDASPTPYHAVAETSRRLRDAGFSGLAEGDAWTLEPGGRYYVVRNQSAIVAFAVGEGDVSECGFRVVGAHTDSPSFKIKPGSCLVTGDGYVAVNTEGYGGSILSSWLDRPLGVAGRVVTRRAGKLRPESTLIDCRRPLLVIPNLAIHFNRDVNSGYAFNKQVDMLPLAGLARGGGCGGEYVAGLIAETARVSADDILDYELFLYDFAPALLVGAEEEFISSGSLDNLAMVHAGLTGLLAATAPRATPVLACFDNEEVGSRTAPGADSDFLSSVLRRICLSRGATADGCFAALANSFAVSADMAHAVHPNHPGSHDPVNRPVLGGGPVIKYSAAQRYATNAVTAGMFIEVCRAAGVPWQRFVNRSDMPGGSTIGPSLSSLTSIPTVDVGTAILAMHSIRELGSVDDVWFAAKAFREFFAIAE